MRWQPIETCPEGVEVLTKIDDDHGERNVQTLVKKTREPGKTRPMFFTPDMVRAAKVAMDAWRDANAIKAHLGTPEQAVIAHMGLNRLRALSGEPT